MEPLPGAPVSPWLARPSDDTYPALGADARAEVAVVGGGIVGVTLALRLAERGASVALVEARRIASAVTGNSTAKVTALHQLAYTQITRGVGAEAAQAFASANVDGVRAIADLVERHGIDCDLERAHNYLYAERADESGDVEGEAAAAQAAGLPVELTNETDLPFEVAVAARLPDQLQLDSAALARGIASAAAAAGARIYERSRVRGVGVGDPCRLELASGAALTADQVVLATQMPLLDRGLYFARLRPQASHAVSAPSDDAPRGMYLGLGERLRSIRSFPGADGGRRVLVGGEGHKVGQADSSHAYRLLADWLAEHFDAGEPDHRWSAHDLMSPDHLPMIGELAPWASRVHVATGFSKWGLALGATSAELLAGALSGERDERLGVFTPVRANLRAALPKLVEENVDVGVRFVAGRGRRDSARKLDPGEGHVVGEGLRQVAECRDADGTHHRLSARCTHLGCIVRWNSGDATWDCPCHGSRFAPDGAVLNGPASAPLGRAD